MPLPDDSYVLEELERIVNEGGALPPSTRRPVVPFHEPRTRDMETAARSPSTPPKQQPSFRDRLNDLINNQQNTRKALDELIHRCGIPDPRIDGPEEDFPPQGSIDRAIDFAHNLQRKIDLSINVLLNQI